jgi:Protein of unknown function (DUF3631)
MCLCQSYRARSLLTWCTPKKRFDRSDRAFSVAREMIAKWRATVSLDLDPEMPAPLCNSRNPRLADNCRPLISVADTFGLKYGEAARAALIELCANLPHSDSGKQMLQDIRTVPFDRISKKALVKALHEIGYWDSWRGPNDQGNPHPLTTGELSRVLRRFRIRARTIWPIPRLPDSKSYSGFYYSDFEEAWRIHCPPENDTSTPASKIIALAKP